MKKFIIGILASLAVSRTFKRELLLVIYKVYTDVNREVDVLPQISIEALRRTNKALMDNKDVLAKSLVNDHRGNFRKFFQERYKHELMNYLGERKSSARDYPTVVNQFINTDPRGGPGPSAGASSIRDAVAQGAINFVNEQAAKAGKPKISDADVVSMQKKLSERGMTEQ